MAVPVAVKEAPAKKEPAPAPAAQPAKQQETPAKKPACQPGEAVIVYQNCSDVKANGAAPIKVGDLGWDQKFDRDGDGVGCES